MGKKLMNKYVQPKSSKSSKAHESDERKLDRMRSMEITRYANYVSKQRDIVQYFIPAEFQKKQKVDPNFNLKGAARPAREFYVDPNFKEVPEAVDLLETHKGRLWEHEEGKVLLKHMLNYGVALHNIAKKTKDAIAVFEEMLVLDNHDHMLARHRLLRCFMDRAGGNHLSEIFSINFPMNAMYHFKHRFSI